MSSIHSHLQWEWYSPKCNDEYYHMAKLRVILVIYFLFIIERDRENVNWGEGQRKRETGRIPGRLCKVVSVQSPMWGSNEMMT